MENKFYEIKKDRFEELKGKALKKVIFEIQNEKDDYCQVIIHLGDREFDCISLTGGHRNVFPIDPKDRELALPKEFCKDFRLDFGDFRYVVEDIKYGLRICSFTNGRGEYIENTMPTYNIQVKYDEEAKDSNPELKTRYRLEYSSIGLATVLRPDILYNHLTDGGEEYFYDILNRFECFSNTHCEIYEVGFFGQCWITPIDSEKFNGMKYETISINNIDISVVYLKDDDEVGYMVKNNNKPVIYKSLFEAFMSNLYYF